MKRSSLRAVAVLVLFVLACAPGSREEPPLEIETVEVGDPVDAGLSTSGDEKERAPRDSGWILSGMLPEDLPLHRPALLVESGETADGRTYFVFHTPSELEAVRAGLTRRLSEAGWSARPGDGGLVAAKGSERVDFLFSPLRPGTVIRVVY